MNTREYKCPHCGEVIKEVSVIELNAKQLIISAGMGFGVGMVVMPIAPRIGILGTLGAFIVAFILTLVLLRRK